MSGPGACKLNSRCWRSAQAVATAHRDATRFCPPLAALRACTTACTHVRYTGGHLCPLFSIQTEQLDLKLTSGLLKSWDLPPASPCSPITVYQMPVGPDGQFAAVLQPGEEACCNWEDCGQVRARSTRQPSVLPHPALPLHPSAAPPPLALQYSANGAGRCDAAQFCMKWGEGKEGGK